MEEHSMAKFKVQVESDKKYEGLMAEVLEVVIYDGIVDLLGPMYKVRFEDGREDIVYEECLSFICTERPYAIFVNDKIFRMFGRPLVWFNRELAVGFLASQLNDKPSARIVELNVDDVPENACVLNTTICTDERSVTFVLNNNNCSKPKRMNTL